MSQSPGERPAVKTCHVCQGTRIYYLFSAADFRVVRCEDCGLVFLNPQPSKEELAGVSTAAGISNRYDDAQTAALYLSGIRRYRGPQTGRLVIIGCGTGEFLAAAESTGWHVTGIEQSAVACETARRRLKGGRVLCTTLEEANLPTEQFDLCVVSDGLEYARSPLSFLREIHRVLKPNGTLLITAHSVDAWSVRYLRQKWAESKALTYFSRQTLQTALFKAGFRDILLQSDTLAFARRTALRPQPVLSIIVPAYNEAKTFSTLMDAVLRKEVPGLTTEIIVVESNSNDGTREAAQKYRAHPKVQLILEDCPRGKGHAVRAGLQAASGDYALIQDADLEYDLEDYDSLLEPLVAGRAAFVLGSRHGGRNVLKMRQFAGEHGLSIFFNFGHWFFTMLINILYLQRLRDPFTMFKVFRRDCLFGMEFECDGFDFDFELLIKLIRKGYRPIELPVNYRSRSFQEGKKVRMFRDPISWLKTLSRLRFAKIDPMSVAEQIHLRESSVRNRGPATAVHE
jgi:glycosyltransferase involved in cell wall biosynthesis/ubiquinone/menaquinone biosynthesis C-methylase UbiE